MRAALALGRHGMGRTAPNPAVGALVVADGVLLGRGITASGGRPHAEPIALAQAGSAAQDATLYVTLEPCSHYGQTPPCVEAVLASGVGRVVVALPDPDPRVAGRGIARLRAAGIQVIEHVGRAEAQRDHRGHCLRVTAGRPMVTLKMAETADGFAAGAVGADRLLITGPVANGYVQGLRATHDAILVGSGTALADDPLLTVRLAGLESRRPFRVVLDGELRLDPRSRLVQSARTTPLLVIAGSGVPNERATRLIDHGAEICLVGRGADGHLDLGQAMRALGQRGITRVLCEGGPCLASSLLSADLADAVVLLTSPDAIGSPGRPSLSKGARNRLSQPSHYVMRDDAPIGRDRLRIFERQDA